jgi:hypothetical protein
MERVRPPGLARAPLEDSALGDETLMPGQFPYALIQCVSKLAGCHLMLSHPLNERLVAAVLTMHGLTIDAAHTLHG